MDACNQVIDDKPHIEGGYVYSDGTTILGADDKAGVSAVIEAVKVLKEENIPHGDVEVIITVGEETGLVGAKALDIKNIKSKFRSEEHTSELQSRFDLVCRLLLEKKKKDIKRIPQ